jgi:hypothetical protein
MNPTPAIIAEARRLADEDRDALQAVMTDIERIELRRKLSRRLRNNLRDIRDETIKNLYRNHEALLASYGNAVRELAMGRVAEPIAGLATA